MKYLNSAFVSVALTLVIFASIDVSLAHGAQSHQAASAHRIVHPWRQVELLNNGSFAFMGSDNIWYRYSQQNGTSFVPSCIPDVFVLPKNGYWTKLSDTPTADTVRETENTIIQWTTDGAPADLQSQDYVCDQGQDA